MHNATCHSVGAHFLYSEESLSKSNESLEEEFRSLQKYGLQKCGLRSTKRHYK